MSLALEWKRASRPEWSPSPSTSRRDRRDLSRMAERSRLSQLTRKLFLLSMAVALMVVAVFIANLFVQDVASRREIRARELEKQIQQERLRQEELRAQVADAESVRELERIAEKVLGMVRGTDPVRVMSEEPEEGRILAGGSP